MGCRWNPQGTAGLRSQDTEGAMRAVALAPQMAGGSMDASTSKPLWGWRSPSRCLGRTAQVVCGLRQLGLRAHEFTSLRDAAGPQTTVCVGPPILSLSLKSNLSLPGIYLKFSSVTLSSLLCFLPLDILFTTILVASREEGKINGCHQLAIVFVKVL